MAIRSCETRCARHCPSPWRSPAILNLQSNCLQARATASRTYTTVRRSTLETAIRRIPTRDSVASPPANFTSLAGRNAIQSLLGEVFRRSRLRDFPSSGNCEVGLLRRAADFGV